VACSGLLAACSSAGAGSHETLPAQVSRAHVQAHWVRVSLGTFADPYGVAVNPYCSSNCTVYVADPGSKMVYKIPAGGTKTPVAAFGDPNFDPQGVSVQHEGGNDRVFIADKGPNVGTRVWDVNVYGNASVCCHGVNYYSAKFPLYNRGVAVFAPPGEFALYAAQATQHPLTTQGRVKCVIHFKTCQFGSTTFSDPYAIAVDGNGAQYVADARDKKAYRIVSGAATDLGKTFVDPYGIAASLDGRTVYVADPGSKEVWKLTR
jgi:DNA-binding beta-propeller fold protein YncE